MRVCERGRERDYGLCVVVFFCLCPKSVVGAAFVPRAAWVAQALAQNSVDRVVGVSQVCDWLGAVSAVIQYYYQHRYVAGLGQATASAEAPVLYIGTCASGTRMPHSTKNCTFTWLCCAIMR